MTVAQRSKVYEQDRERRAAPPSGTAWFVALRRRCRLHVLGQSVHPVVDDRRYCPSGKESSEVSLSPSRRTTPPTNHTFSATTALFTSASWSRFRSWSATTMALDKPSENTSTASGWTKSAPTVTRFVNLLHKLSIVHQYISEIGVSSYKTVPLPCL